MDIKQSSAFCALFLIIAGIWAVVNANLEFPNGGEPALYIGYLIGGLGSGTLLALPAALISVMFKRRFWPAFLLVWGPASVLMQYFSYYGLTN